MHLAIQINKPFSTRALYAPARSINRVTCISGVAPGRDPRPPRSIPVAAVTFALTGVLAVAMRKRNWSGAKIVDVSISVCRPQRALPLASN